MPRPIEVKYYETACGAYNPILAQTYKKNARSEAISVLPAHRLPFSKTTLFVNIMLVAGFALALVVYVLLANGISAGRYSVKLLNENAAAIADQNGALQAAQANSVDTMALMKFAATHNMIPASDAAHIFEDNGFALWR